jgi:hypothetical protein
MFFCLSLSLYLSVTLSIRDCDYNLFTRIYPLQTIYFSRGYVQVEHSYVGKNMADGVKYYYHDQRPETKMVDGVDVHDFCTYSTTYSQTYPFLMVAEQYEDSAVDRYVFYCC